MSLRQVEVTTWYLEQLSAGELRPARDPGPGVEITRAEIPSPEFSRFLYTAVGGDWLWTDRLPWTCDQWAAWLDRPGTETWVAYLRGTPAGYFELDPQAEAVVELSCFGLLPAFIGKGIGGRLLECAMTRAWDLAERWPERTPTKRVWVHTSSLDGPAALGNYQARGLRVYDITTEQAQLPLEAPGPWPNAR
jgi:GNAT superfamily N-acetyltransferase